MLVTFGTALVVFSAAVLAMLTARWAGEVLAHVDLTAPERVPFTGGHPPEVHAWNRYHARYYVMALLFLVFDMEMVYMYPWAVVFVREGAVAFVEMGMFIGILLLGVLYAWRERGLDWS